MNTEAFHSAVTARDTAIRHCPHHVVQSFRLQRNIIPESIVGALPLWNCPVRFWFYRMNKIGEFMRILDKEDWRVIANEVKNTLFSIELGGKTTDITYGIGRASTTLNGRETYKYWGDFVRI